MFGVCGAAAVLAGSGRLRLFLTSLMLEMTSQAALGPFVAVAAVIGVFVGSFCTHHGLYHGLIELARAPLHMRCIVATQRLMQRLFRGRRACRTSRTTTCRRTRRTARTRGARPSSPPS